ncbi:MAG: hypothetical protein WD552_00360 [Candidatus Paceibacterota bacterium]
MINQQLLDYIKKQQEAGTADEIIEENLLQAGWRQGDVDDGFQAVSGDPEGDNSTAAHQKMREAAAEKRDDQDTYREEVTVEETADSQSTTDSKSEAQAVSLSPIDGTASSTVTSDSNNFNNDDTDTEGMEEVSSEIVGSKTTGDSLNKLAKQDMNQAAADESMPQAVRTFQSDSQRAGVDDDRKAEAQKQVRQKPESMPSEAQDIEELAKAEAEKEAQKAEQEKEQAKRQEELEQKRQEEQARKELRQREEEKRRRAEEDRKRREQEKQRQAQEQSGREKPQQSQEMQPQNNDAVAASSMADMDEPARETSDGRRRFSGAGEPKQVKRRVARQKRQKESSGSNVTSILVFIVALVLVGGGAAWAYFTYFQTSTPETTAAGVVESLASAETFSFRTTVDVAGEGGVEKGRFVIEGAVDLNPDTPASSYYIISQDGQLARPIQAVMAETENIITVPQAQRETISEILLTPEFFSIGEFQTQERLGQTQDNEGFITARFGISMSPRQLVSDYATLHQALFDAPLSGAVLESLQASVSGFTPTQGQTWIDPETGAPYQITFIGTNAAGQDVQVNLQFKNHGQPLTDTPPYETRSFEQALGQYFSMMAGSQAMVTDSTNTSETNASNPELRYDRLRINDIQQLAVALHVYANKNDAFPTTLTALTQSSGAIMSTVPQDPVTDAPYIYSVSPDGSRYHLGATLEVLTRSDLFDDANFNSRGQGFPNGFNGAAASCGESSETGAATSTTSTTTDVNTTCYDIAGLVE